MHRLFATRRAFLSTLGAAACLPAFGKKTAVENRPNILLILAGDLPASMLSCYGSTDHKTPNIDALARRGVHFQNALASSRGGATGRATLLTGRTPLQNGLSSPGATLPANEVLLTDLLSGQGFDVGYVGVWTLGDDKQPGHGIRSSYIVEGGEANDSAFSSGEPIRRALQFLDQQSESKPFFLTVSYPSGPATAAAIDNQLPDLIGKLRSRRLEEKTIVIFTSCGGTPESLRLPMIQCWPGQIPVESRPPELVGSYDFFPTICDLVGAVAPDRNLCGRSYLPLVLSKPFPKKKRWGTTEYGTFGNVDTARDTRFKLILREGGKGPNQLFDMRDDPKQITNEFVNRNYITMRDELRRNLMEWKGKYSK